MKAYSQDVREKVLRAVDQGYARAEIVKLLGVSGAPIKRYLKQRRETGDVAAKAIPGRPSKKLSALQAELTPQLQAHDDVSLAEHCRRLRTPSRHAREPLDYARGHQAVGLDT